MHMRKIRLPGPSSRRLLRKSGGRCLLAAAALLFLTACGSGRPKSSEAGESGTAVASTPPTATAVAATARFHVDSVVQLRGRVVLAHEVRAFIPEGDTVEYWIVDRSGALERAYDRATGGQKNGKPAWAELKVRYKGPSDEGFAADYTGVFEVVELVSVEKAEE